MTNIVDFQVRKTRLDETRVVHGPDIADITLDDGQILVAIEAFAFTANNTTYAAMGEAMKYWEFYPAEDDWGHVPVWGFASVIATTLPQLETGERIYGFFPMASHAILCPAKISAGGFVDSAVHRRELHPVYNHYVRNAADPGYDERFEDQQMLLRPLFMTSFLIDDFLADNGFFGASEVILSSASSKTAYGVAHLLHKLRQDECTVTGLTSAGNLGFVNDLNCYDTVVAYDDIATLDAKNDVVFVDIAGNSRVRADLHNHFGNQLKYSCAVGAAHWDKLSSDDNLPGARPVMFFAPAQIKKRQQDWGPGGIEQRFAREWIDFIGEAASRISAEHHHGVDAVKEQYLATLRGAASPATGLILSLAPQQ